jgi:phage tail-like protein
MPGLIKYGNVTLKRITVKSDNRFTDWLDQIATNTIKRVPVTISLIGESGSPSIVWPLDNAWPAKVVGTDQKPDGNEGTIETIELAYEGISVING